MADPVMDKLIVLMALPIMFLIVFITHELGHYLMARLFNVKIKSFTIGVGSVMHRTHHGPDKTPLTIHFWPVNGQVALDEKSLNRLSPIKRILIIIAGPLANMVLPFFLIFPFLLVFGLPAQPPVIASLMTDGAAREAGLELGDKIVAINGQPTNRFEDLHPYSWALPLKPFSLTVAREGEQYDYELTAKYKEYIDRTGIQQKHGQIGVNSPQAVFPLKYIYEINGIEVEDDPKKARALLTAADKDVITLKTKGADDKKYNYLVRMDLDANPYLNDPDHRERKFLYIHPLRDSYYIDMPLGQSLYEAARLTGQKVADIASVPLQLFPLDKDKLHYTANLHDRVRPGRNTLFLLIFKTTILSITIGFINLLPLPRLDGSALLYELWILRTGAIPTNRQKALLIATTLGFLYATVALINFPRMPVYFDKKFKNTQEWLEDFGADD